MLKHSVIEGVDLGLFETWHRNCPGFLRCSSTFFVDGLGRAVHDACSDVSLMASLDSRFAHSTQTILSSWRTVLDAVSADTGSRSVRSWAVQIRRHGFRSAKKPLCVPCDIGRCRPRCGHRHGVIDLLGGARLAQHCLGLGILCRIIAFKSLDHKVIFSRQSASLASPVVLFHCLQGTPDAVNMGHLSNQHVLLPGRTSA